MEKFNFYKSIENIFPVILRPHRGVLGEKWLEKKFGLWQYHRYIRGISSRWVWEIYFFNYFLNKVKVIYWIKWNRCVCVFLLEGTVCEFWPQSGTIWHNRVSRKNDSNNFNDTWYQHSLGWRLSLGGVGQHMKTIVCSLEGPQKYKLLNRWTDSMEFFKILEKNKRNKNFKKLTVTPCCCWPPDDVKTP